MRMVWLQSIAVNMLDFEEMHIFFETQQSQQNERPDHGHSIRDEPKSTEGQPLYVGGH